MKWVCKQRDMGGDKVREEWKEGEVGKREGIVKRD